MKREAAQVRTGGGGAGHGERRLRYAQGEGALAT